MTASRVPNGAIELDGRLDEIVLAEQCRWSPIFLRRSRTRALRRASEPKSDSSTMMMRCTSVHACTRDHPDSLRLDVNRRDNPGNCEQMIVSIDSYFDRRTCYDFGVSAAGVRTDRYHAADDEYDRNTSFNPVWHAHAHVDSLGWTCEMMIPFSQLRFIDKPEQVWGVNMNRWIPARNEDDFWIAVPRNETGWSSWFGELHGITGVEPARRLELLPYAAGDAKFESGQASNDPFHDGSDFEGRVGGDLKMGLGPNLTLDATINPDFGQVEADPAEVNLTAFETAFSEKRPFFIEGSRLFEVEGPIIFLYQAHWYTTARLCGRRFC